MRGGGGGGVGLRRAKTILTPLCYANLSAACDGLTVGEGRMERSRLECISPELLFCFFTVKPHV